MEAEAILVGPWKNFEELEESISLDELNLIVKAVYEKERRTHKIMAALKGVNLDGGEPEEDPKTRFERAQVRAQARLQGLSDEEVDDAEEATVLQGMGFTLVKQ